MIAIGANGGFARLAGAALLTSALAPAAASATNGDVPTIVVTADVEGTLRACGSCPEKAATGGIARWRAAVADLGPVVHVDAGGFLFGGEDPTTVVRAYAAANLAAVNVSTADLRLGLEFTRDLLKESDVPAVSANLLDASGTPIFAPFVVTEIDGGLVAVVGVTERPAALDALPHLKQQLAGVTVAEPVDVLGDVLLEARAAADHVVLLVHGSRAAVTTLRERFGGDVDAIGAGGLGPNEPLPTDAGSPVLVAPRRATHVAVLESGTGSPALRAVGTDLAEDPAVLAALANPDVSAVKSDEPEAPAGELEMGASLDGVALAGASGEPGAETGVLVRVSGARTTGVLGERTAPPGSTFLVLSTAFENDIPLDLAFDGSRDAGERILVAFRQRLSLVVGSGDAQAVRAYAVTREVELEGFLPDSFVLESLGSTANGDVAFMIPTDVVESGADAVALRLDHDEFGAIVAPVRGTLPQEGEFVAAAENEWLELAQPTVRFPDAVDGDAPPRGMRWVEVELVGRSTRDLEPEGAKDAQQAPGGGLGAALGRAASLEPETEDAPDAAPNRPTTATYLEADSHLQLVADGQWATTRAGGRGTLAPEPVFLPDRTSGGTAVFLAPADATSLELQAIFPQLQGVTKSGGAAKPDTLRFQILGEPVESMAEEALVVVDDEPVDMAIVGAAPIDAIGTRVPEDGRAFVALDVRLRNEGAEDGGLLLEHRFRGEGFEYVAAMSRGDAALDEPLLLPAASRRAMRVVLDVPERALGRETFTLDYVGITVNPTLEVALGPERTIAAATPVAESGVGDAPRDEVPPAPRGGVEIVPFDWAVPGTFDAIAGAPPELGGLAATAENGAVRLDVDSMELVEEIGGRTARPGQTHLVLHTRWTNLLPASDETKGAAPRLDVDTRESLHLVVNGRTIVGRALAGPNKLPGSVVVPVWNETVAWMRERDGDAPRETAGTLVYTVPTDALRSIELHLLDPEHGNFVLPLAGERPDASPAAPLRTNAVAAVAPRGWRVEASGRNDGHVFVAVDLRGRSRCAAGPFEHGGRAEPVAFSPRRWKDGRMHLLVDGVHPIGVADAELPNQLLWLPDADVGGTVRFRVREDALRAAGRVDLVVGFGETVVPDGPVARLAPMIFALKDGAARAVADGPGLWTIDDGGLVTTTLDRREGAGDLEGATVVRFRVRNDRETEAWFEPTRALRVFVPDGTEVKVDRNRMDAVPLAVRHRKPVWIPAGAVRAFELPFVLPDEAVRVRYEGLLRRVDVALEEGAQPEPPTMPQVNGVDVVDRARPLGGIESVGLDGGRVNRAIDRGRDWMWARLQESMAKGRPLGANEADLVTMLALVHADAHETYPAFDEALRAYLDRARPLEVGAKSTYQNGLLAMTIASYGDPTYMPLLRDVARYLIEDQGPAGTWNYGGEVPQRLFDLPPVDVEGEAPRASGPLTVSGGPPRSPASPTDAAVARAPRRHLPWEVNGNGDNSVTQYAALGLNACSRAGVEIDPDVWRRLLQAMWDRHWKDGGWGYNGGTSYGSMTCAGAAIAGIAMRELEPDRDPVLDPRIREGLAWLGDHFAVGLNPESTNDGDYHVYYAKYGFERVGRLLNTEFFGPHEWYPVMAKWLVDAQSDSGAWPGSYGEKPELTTPFAVLFLTRATETLDPEALAAERAAAEANRPTTGRLEMRARTSAAKAVVFVLDASGSMMAPPGDAKARKGKKVTKFELARAALAETLTKLPDGAPVGLVVYGHRKRARDEGANEDVEIVVPVGPLDRDAFAAKLAALRARGKTPLALSLDAARRASREAGPRNGTVVLLTDGGQGREPGDPVKSATSIGRGGLTLEIVGFDVDASRSRTTATWTEQLKAMADAAEGRFTPVDDASRLAPAVAAASTGLPGDFELVDANGEVAASGPFGGTLELDPGDYTFRTTFAGEPFECEVRIGRGRTTRVEFDGAGAR